MKSWVWVGLMVGTRSMGEEVGWGYPPNKPSNIGACAKILKDQRMTTSLK